MDDTLSIRKQDLGSFTLGDTSLRKLNNEDKSDSQAHVEPIEMSQGLSGDGGGFKVPKKKQIVLFSMLCIVLSAY